MADLTIFRQNRQIYQADFALTNLTKIRHIRERFLSLTKLLLGFLDIGLR